MKPRRVKSATSVSKTKFDQEDEKEEKLKKIITTGQFTTCCNLLEYLTSLERKGLTFNDKTTKQLADLKDKLSIDFNHFKWKPFYLYEIMEDKK